MAQYRLIAELCGSPDRELLAKLASNEAILNVITKLGVYPRKVFADYFPKSFSRALVDFLDRILVLDPEKRWIYAYLYRLIRKMLFVEKFEIL